MKAIVNKTLTHILFDFEIKSGTKIEVEEETTRSGLKQIVSPEEYAEIFIAVEDIDFI